MRASPRLPFSFTDELLTVDSCAMPWKIMLVGGRRTFAGASCDHVIAEQKWISLSFLGLAVFLQKVAEVLGLFGGLWRVIRA
jgi:hypothetical protein